ncbi:acylpyruvate hydrolase, partial [Phenoliferia sp. Uapishka_3]
MSSASEFATRGKKVGRSCIDALHHSKHAYIFRSQIIAIGRNYAAHIAELNNTTPTEPFYFLKPTTCYVVNDGPVECPRGVELHHETELGVVIGKEGRDIKREDAMSFVAGYCLSIDYTARNMQLAAKKKGLPWAAAKGFDTFCPVSGFIPKEDVSDPHDLMLWYKVNGEQRQRGTTGLMLWRIEDLISFVSGIVTLEEGDLILTGTPEGVSQVVPGDKIEAGLEQNGKSLAQIRHTIIARETGYEFKA